MSVIYQGSTPRAPVVKRKPNVIDRGLWVEGQTVVFSLIARNLGMNRKGLIDRGENRGIVRGFHARRFALRGCAPNRQPSSDALMTDTDQ